jgi:hypothetical protein
MPLLAVVEAVVVGMQQQSAGGCLLMPHPLWSPGQWEGIPSLGLRAMRAEVVLVACVLLPTQQLVQETFLLLRARGQLL